MENTIIELTKTNYHGQCLLCCEREATVKLEIRRVKYGDSVIGFYACDTCLAKMQKDIHKICE